MAGRMSVSPRLCSCRDRSAAPQQLQGRSAQDSRDLYLRDIPVLAVGQFAQFHIGCDFDNREG